MQSFLILSTRGGWKRPILADVTGREDREVYFRTNGINTYDSCSIMWQNNWYMFGSGNQVIELSSCELRQIGRLPFTFSQGACTVTNDENIYLCFSTEEYKLCRILSDPLGNATEVIDSIYDHKIITIAAGEGNLSFISISRMLFLEEILAVGSNNPKHAHAELLRLDRMQWHAISDYPWHANGALSHHSTVYLKGFYYIFGGWDGSVPMKRIGRLDAITTTWKSMGDMAHARYGHTTLWTGNEFLTVGGQQDSLWTVRCWFEGEGMACKCFTPQLSQWGLWPQVILVEDDYCQFWPNC